MLEGLKLNIVSFKEVWNDKIFRLEADFNIARTKINIKTLKGEDIIDFVQYGTSDELNELNQGFPVLRLNEFDSYFIDKPAKYCSLISNSEFENLRLKIGDVLICRTNGNPKLVGRAAIVLENTKYAYFYFTKLKRLENK